MHVHTFPRPSPNLSLGCRIVFQLLLIPLDVTSIAPWHVSFVLWAPFYLSHHTIRLSVSLRTLPREIPTERQSSLHGLTLLTATLLLPALELLKEAIDKAGYTDKIVIGMDVAASEFYRDGKYDLDFKSPDDPSRYISADELGDLYQSFVRDYPGKLLCLAVGTGVAYLTGASPLCFWGGKGGSFDSCFFCCPFSGLH